MPTVLTSLVMLPCRLDGAHSCINLAVTFKHVGMGWGTHSCNTAFEGVAEGWGVRGEEEMKWPNSILKPRLALSPQMVLCKKLVTAR